MKKEQPAIRDDLQADPVSYEVRLNLKDSFYGGRTNCVKKFVKVEGDSRLRCTDICSLYPFINQFGKYPSQHPIQQLHPNCPHPNDFEGLIKCKVLPPDNLYHPVLPLHMHGKLMFVLCNNFVEDVRRKVRKTAIIRMKRE